MRRILLLMVAVLCITVASAQEKGEYNRQIKKFPTEKQNVSLKHILT